MARQIAPGNPPAIEAQQFKVTMPDFKELDQLGDAKIKASEQNFKLYADVTVKTEAAKLYEQYKDDPIMLSNALSKLPGMIKGLPENIQDEMNGKLYLLGVSLVQKAENNRLTATDLENAKNANTSIELSKALMAQEYQNILQNHIASADEKRPVSNNVSNDIFVEQQINLNNLADLQNHNGQNVYSEAQRKAIRNVDDLELEGFKQFFDKMLINDNDKLEKSKEYYQSFLLAPERFMQENYMNRETYEKAVAYAKKELERAGADIKKMKFKQSVGDYLTLQVKDKPGKVKALRQSGLLPKEMIDQMEKVNVKFNEIDPSKTESPVALINTLELLKQYSFRTPTTEAEQQEILETGTRALDMLADYGQTYGLSQKTIDAARQNVVLLENNAAFAPILNNFADIIDNFHNNLDKVRAAQKMEGGKGKWWSLTRVDGMSNEEAQKYVALNSLLANNLTALNYAIRAGDNESVRKIQRETQVSAAKILHDWIDWQEAEKNKESVFSRNGLFVRPVGIKPNGDVNFKILD